MNRKPELTKEESEGFKRFVKEHYVEMMRQALDVAKTVTKRVLPDDRIVIAVFEKLATPRVFLIDSWRKLSPEEHMVYSYPDPVEREKAKAKAEEISKQAREMIQT